MKAAAFQLKAKDEWYSGNDVPLSVGEINRLLHTAYGGAGLDVLVSATALLQEATDWIVGVDDDNPSVYHWFTAYKRTPFGNKIIYSGQDGNRESIAELKMNRKQILADAGYHFYVEASHGWMAILERWGISKVPFEVAQRVLSPKHLTPVEDDPYAYIRILGGSPICKVMFGHPNVKTHVAHLVELWLD